MPKLQPLPPDPYTAPFEIEGSGAQEGAAYAKSTLTDLLDLARSLAPGAGLKDGMGIADELTNGQYGLALSSAISAVGDMAMMTAPITGGGGAVVGAGLKLGGKGLRSILPIVKNIAKDPNKRDLFTLTSEALAEGYDIPDEAYDTAYKNKTGGMVRNPYPYEPKTIQKRRN